MPEETYRAIVAAMGESAMLIAYFDSGKFIAGILMLREGGVLYLLQWSEISKLDGIAFDLICHRPIEYAIDNRIRCVDSGLAADHKHFRTWKKLPVYHAHWIFNDELRKLAECEILSAEVPPPRPLG